MNMKVFGGALLNYLFNNVISHIPVHAVRRGFIRAFNPNVHSTAVILMHCRILNFWKIIVKERVVINQYCVLDCRHHRITIERDTDIGPYTRIWTLGHNPNSESHELYGGDVIINHHVWIASGVIILPSVQVGAGAVIAAGSVVHKDVETLSIVGGNPAKFIKHRSNSLSYKLNFRPYFE